MRDYIWHKSEGRDMAGWEYCQLDVWAVWEHENPADKSSPWKEPVYKKAINHGDGSEVKIIEGDPPSLQVLNGLGKEGWEVFDTQTTAHAAYIAEWACHKQVTDTVTYLLKRPLKEELWTATR